MTVMTKKKNHRKSEDLDEKKFLKNLNSCCQQDNASIN